MTFYAKWHPDHDEALKRMFTAGLSFAQIAAKLHGEFGADYSRNACIGRAHRLKLSQADKPKPKLPGRPRAEKREVVVHFPRKPHRALPKIPKEEVEQRCANVVPRNLTIYELTKATCKWPYGDAAPYTFCGCQTFPGFPYCAEHVALGTSEGRGFSQSILQKTASRRSNVGTDMTLAGLSSLDGEDAA